MVESKVNAATGRAEGMALFALLAGALYMVYFRGFTRMGLYEDDWSALAPYANGDWSQTWHQVWQWLSHWPNGRPLGLGTCALAGWGLYHLGGMAALYLLPFGIVLACAWTIKRILERTLGPAAAFGGALTFALLPTDTLRLSLHAAPHLYLAALCMLLAIAAFESERSWLALPLTFVGMLFHETSTPTIFLGPLLSFSLQRPFFRRALSYWAFAFAGLVAVLLCRVFIFGEERASATFSSLPQVVERSLISLRTGFPAHFSLILQRCREGFQFPLAGSALAFVTILGVLAAVSMWPWREGGHGPAKPRRQMVASGLALGFGLLAMAAPYPCYFTDPYWPANHVAGRLASVHSASGVGFAFCVAGVIQILGLVPWASLRGLAFATLLIPLAALLSWGNIVRSQYLEAWENQQNFWSSIIPQVGNLRPGTIAFVEWDNAATPPFTWVIGTSSWADSVVLGNLYDFPRQGSPEPRLFRIVGPWQQTVRTQDGKVYWDLPAGDWPAAVLELKPGHLMVFKMREGRPTPVAGPGLVNDVSLPLIPASDGVQLSDPKKPLFHDLIVPSPSTR